jgi:anti-sigma factor RsiW
MTPSQTRMPQDPTVLVHAYLDGELSAADSAEAERAIGASSALAAEAAAVGALKHALHTRLLPEALPPRFASRIADSVGLRTPARRPGWIALAASVVLAMGFSSVVTAVVLRNQDDGIYAESVDSHLRSLMAPNPVDVASSERHIVKPWFNGKAVQSPKVPDLGTQGFPLMGGRIDVIRGVPVPAVVYKRRLHTISVWAANDALASRLTKKAQSINGTNLVVWRAGDMTYFAASDLNAAELSTFVGLFAAAP